MKLLILAGEIYTPSERIERGFILVSGERVEALGPERALGAELRDSADEVIEAGDLIAAPGFIEVHINGAGGRDAAEGTAESLSVISRTLARFGTTSFLPTIITAPEAEMLRALEGLADAMDEIEGGARPLGIHMEGPFLSAARRGVHPAEHLRLPDVRFLEKAWRAARGKLKIITLAPELSGALELIRGARALGAVAALGHSDARYEQALAAIEAGASHAVHVYNGMRSFNHRDPGILAAALGDDRLSAEIIADGIHVHPAAVDIFVRAKARDKIVLSTDAISAAGMPDGRYLLSGREIVVRDGACRDREGRLAGSSLMQDRALRNLIAWTGISFQDALAAASLNAARALGLEDRGALAPGNYADIIILDKQLEVMRTIVAGRTVYSKGNRGG